MNRKKASLGKEKRAMILTAIRNDSLEEIQDFIKDGVSVNTYLGYESGNQVIRYTLTGVAIMENSLKALSFLIAQGADVNRVLYLHTWDEQEIFPPIYLACSLGRMRAIHLLADAGANCDVELQGLQVLEEEGGILHYTGNGNTCLHWSTLHHRLPVLQALLDSGSDPLKRNVSQETAFHLACEAYQPHCITALVKAGGVASNVDMYGTTPLKNIVTYEGDCDEQSELIRLILYAGYDPCHDPWVGDTSLSAEWNSHANTLEGDRESVGLKVMLRRKYGKDFLNWISDWYREVPRLKHACRLTVRQEIGSIKLEQKVSGLPIPETLKQYVSLCYI